MNKRTAAGDGGIKLNKIATAAFQYASMQMIKGLITLLLVAAAVFTGVMIFNKATEPRHNAKTQQAVIGKTPVTDAHQKIQKTTL